MKMNADGEYEFDTSAKLKDDKSEINEDAQLEDYEYQKALDEILQDKNADNKTKFHKLQELKEQFAKRRKVFE